MSPTQLSLRYLRRQGWPLLEVVEHWNPFARVRKDMFGFVDILAAEADLVLAVQTTTAPNVNARIAKIRSLPTAVTWLHSPNRELHVHGWAKDHRGHWQLKRSVILMMSQNTRQIKEVEM